MTRVFKGEWVRIQDTNTLVLVVDASDPNAIIGIKYRNSRAELTIVRQDVEKVAYEIAISDTQDTFRLVTAPLYADISVFEPEVIDAARTLLGAVKYHYWENQNLQEVLGVGTARLRKVE